MAHFSKESKKGKPKATEYLEDKDVDVETQLRTIIREALNSPDCNKYTNLCQQVNSKQGMAAAEEWIFTQCATNGIAVQTAMSDYDSSLAE